MANNKKFIYSNDQGYGENGILGDRFVSVAGWEHGTVGFAGNVYSRLCAENGIQPVDPSITAAREPFRQGRFLLKMLKTVPFFDPKVTAAWRMIIEDWTTEFSGIQNYSFETIKQEHGVIHVASTYAGIYRETNGEFSIKVPETAGQLVRKALDYWFFGMSDPKTGVTHFYGKDMRALQPNMAMSVLYVLLGPTCRPEDIEFACIYHDFIPTTPLQDHNNAQALGEAGSGVQLDITFAGTYDRGSEVDRLAAMVVDREGLYEERHQNALLPAYIYKEYLGLDGSKSVEFTNANIGMKLEDRVAASIEQTEGSLVTDGDVKQVGNQALLSPYADDKGESIVADVYATAFKNNKRTSGEVARTEMGEGYSSLQIPTIPGQTGVIRTKTTQEEQKSMMQGGNLKPGE